MRIHPLPTRRCRGRRAGAAALLLTCALTACLRNPAADAATAEALNEIGEHVGALQQENAELQNQIDSLRGIVARQDTVLRRLANLAGVPMAP